MKATFVALGVVAVLAAAAPAVAGVTGNSALSREVAVKTAPSPSASTHSATPTSATPDDKGGLRDRNTRTEPGDDRGTHGSTHDTPSAHTTHSTPTARPSATRSTHHAEPGDDHGGRNRGRDDSGRDDSGRDDNSNSGKNRHGGGSDDGPNHG